MFAEKGLYIVLASSSIEKWLCRGGGFMESSALGEFLKGDKIG